MKYPKIDRAISKKQNIVRTLSELGSIYNECSTIDEYKVKRDLANLKCPTLVDVFYVYYMTRNYGTWICMIPVILVPLLIFSGTVVLMTCWIDFLGSARTAVFVGTALLDALYAFIALQCIGHWREIAYKYI